MNEEEIIIQDSLEDTEVIESENILEEVPTSDSIADLDYISIPKDLYDLLVNDTLEDAEEDIIIDEPIIENDDSIDYQYIYDSLSSINSTLCADNSISMNNFINSDISDMPADLVLLSLIFLISILNLFVSVVRRFM